MTSADFVALIKKHPIGFSCLMVAIISGAGVYLRYGNMSANQQELDAKSAEVSKITNNIRNSVNLSEQVTEIQSLTRELESRLLKSSQLAVNLQYFYKLETENGVKLVDVRQNSLARNTKPSAFIGVPFNITVQGTYSQVTNFLGRLQNGRHLCRINSANFTKIPTADGSEVFVNLSLNLELLGLP